MLYTMQAEQKSSATFTLLFNSGTKIGNYLGQNEFVYDTLKWAGKSAYDYGTQYFMNRMRGRDSDDLVREVNEENFGNIFFPVMKKVLKSAFE